MGLGVPRVVCCSRARWARSKKMKIKGEPGEPSWDFGIKSRQPQRAGLQHSVTDETHGCVPVRSTAFRRSAVWGSAVAGSPKRRRAPQSKGAGLAIAIVEEDPLAKPQRSPRGNANGDSFAGLTAWRENQTGSCDRSGRSQRDRLQFGAWISAVAAHAGRGPMGGETRGGSFNA